MDVTLVNHATFATVDVVTTHCVATDCVATNGSVEDMAIRVLPYVTLEVDERLRRRVRRAGDRLRVTVRSYLLSAADDVDTATDRVRDLCDAAVHRVDTVVTRVNDRIDPAGTAASDTEAAGPDPTRPVRLEAV